MSKVVSARLTDETIEAMKEIILSGKEGTFAGIMEKAVRRFVRDETNKEPLSFAVCHGCQQRISDSKDVDLLFFSVDLTPADLTPDYYRDHFVNGEGGKEITFLCCSSCKTILTAIPESGA